MKKFLIAIFVILAALQVKAQVEINVSAASVFNNYSGGFTSNSSFINATSGNTGYTNNPYGKKLTFGYGFNAQLQVVTGGFIVGLQSGYEVAKSDMPISGVQLLVFQTEYYNYTAITANTPAPAHGTTTLTSNTVNINPYFGYRIRAGLAHIDLTPGVDIALQTGLTDKGKAQLDNNNSVYYVNRNDFPKHTDARLRMGVTVGIKNYSIFAAYAHGMTNLASGMYGDAKFDVHSNLWRLGLSYRLF